MMNIANFFLVIIIKTAQNYISLRTNRNFPEGIIAESVLVYYIVGFLHTASSIRQNFGSSPSKYINLWIILEFIFNFLPCKMCVQQRYPYYFIIIIFILFYLFNKKINLLFNILTEFAIIYGLFYSVWHVGIEQ